jgi:hypothetical protein
LIVGTGVSGFGVEFRFWASTTALMPLKSPTFKVRRSGDTFIE